MNAETKKCSKCKEIKPVSEFGARSDKPYLLKSWCNLCIAKKANRVYHTTKSVPEKKTAKQAAQARYRETHQSEIRARDKIYREKNKDRERERLKRAKRELREQMIKAYGGKCSCCGEARYEFLTLEHTNGDGGKERKVYKSTDTVLRRLRDQGWPKNGYSVLCWNCNSARGVYGYCPHEKERVS